MLRREQGFTLLELLVALTVLGVLMVLMFGGLRFGARVWESGDAGLRSMVEMQAAAGLIRRQIAQALPTTTGGFAGPGGGGGEGGGGGGVGGIGSVGATGGLGGLGGGGRMGAGVPPFTGTPDALRLVGPPPSQLLPGGLYETVIGLEDGVGGAGGRRLSVWWRRLSPGNGAEPSIEADLGTRRVVLIDGIAEFRLSYYGQSGDVNEPPQWHDRWDTVLSLPSLVSVQMAFMPGDRRIWPQFVVAPMASPAY